ncbi:DNA alkylation repair protein [Clostridium sp. Mt-5]|uniref:DNA alkylation repair protein n=1 Tax=Clostridium moutaii TaxID=3240932 RepID=A0ABV4BU31_9CLOT
MKQKIRDQIFELADEKYKEFHTKLSPTDSNIVGVRMPVLRKIAKEIARGDWREYLKTAENEYYEEIMIQGMVIGYIKVDVEERLKLIEKFVPKIDGWGICDSFCNGLKFIKSNRERVWNFIQPYLRSNHEFYIRFGVVVLLDFYIDEVYVNSVLDALDKIKYDGYYVKMAVAWALSTCYIKFPENTMAYLKNNSLDDFTYNKSLQKITESLRIDNKTKLVIKNMKRK